MSRMKGMAPPPPPGGKAKSATSTSADLSLLLMFDDLTRNEKVSFNNRIFTLLFLPLLQVLNDGTTEEKFLQFAINQEHCRKRWEAAEHECQRLQIELQSSEQVGIFIFTFTSRAYIARLRLSMGLLA